MAIPISVVDAFSDRPFAGNPAAVVLPGRPVGEAWMQAVAAEMNLSESAFVVPRDDGDHDLRWFTPSVEIDLCGHATLASAHVLGGAARFHTRSGLLSCQPAGDGWIEMDFPARPAGPTSHGPELARALGTTEVYTVSLVERDLLVELGSADDVRTLRPDHAALGRLGWREVVVTAPGDRPGIDCVSRVFGPGVGIVEDPVTGAAHCVLAPYWAPRVGRTELVGEQASARGGVVRMRLDADRVVLGGQATTVWRGDLLAEPPAD